VNIREVIDRLRGIADDLPEGLDSPVRLRLCNGFDEPGVMTRSIEVDTAQIVNKRTGETTAFAEVCGHPHLDEGDTTVRYPVNDIDTLVDQWASEQAAETAPGATEADGLVFIGRHMFMPASGGGFIRMEITDDRKLKYAPGSPDAVAASCTCDPEKNNHGRGQESTTGSVYMITKEDCPLHLKVDRLPDVDS
jgi:hypothetical protein